MAPFWIYGSFDRLSKSDAALFGFALEIYVETVVSIWLPTLANPGGGQTMLAKSQLDLFDRLNKAAKSYTRATWIMQSRVLRGPAGAW
jgi:hypothetical protein